MPGKTGKSKKCIVGGSESRPDLWSWRVPVPPPSAPFIPPRSWLVKQAYDNYDGSMRFRTYEYELKQIRNNLTKLMGEHTMETEKILEQMQAKVAAFKAKREQILSEQGQRLSELGLGHWGNRKAAEEKRESVIGETEGRIEAAERRLCTELDALRKQAEAAYTADLAEVEAAYYDNLHARDPHGAAQWQEAAARAPFIRSELLGLPSGDIVRNFLHASARGDGVGTYLVGTVGPEILQARLSEHEPLTKGHSEALEALHDLRAVTTEPAESAHADDLARLKDLLGKVNRPMAPSELEREVRNLGVNVPKQPIEFPADDAPTDGPEFQPSAVAAKPPRDY